MQRSYKRLEAIEQRLESLTGKHDSGVVTVPTIQVNGRMAMSDESIQAAITEKRKRTGFTGGYVVLPEVLV